MDADEIPLYSKKLGKKMERDIVQFVPFREYKNNAIALAKQTLEEIPRQLTSYMNSKGIKPTKPELVNMQKASFFEAQRFQFVNALLAANFTQDKIEEILAKGLPEHSLDLFKASVFNPYFRNQLTEMNAFYKS